MPFHIVPKEEKDAIENKISELEIYEPVVVLELFTSQGCSSCPSADVLLEKVKNEYEREVYALSYHVDYWNYIGWEDPFSKSVYSRKQGQYNIKFRNNSNYTPQLVVNGKEHFVGSNKGRIYAGIDKYKKRKSINELTLSAVMADKDVLVFKYGVKGNSAGKTLRALLVLDERTTLVKRGENRNRTLKNNNIVVSEKTIVLEKSDGTAKITIPEIVKKNEKISLIVLVEDSDYDITAAAKQQIERI